MKNLEMGSSKLLLLLADFSVAQTYHIPEATTCASTQFLNGATLQCEDCPANSAQDSQDWGVRKNSLTMMDTVMAR